MSLVLPVDATDEAVGAGFARSWMLNLLGCHEACHWEMGLLAELMKNTVQQHVQLMECSNGAAWKNSSLQKC